MKNLEHRDQDELNDLAFFFKKIIGGNVSFSENIPNDREKIFITFMKKLEESIELEDIILIHSGINLSKVLDPIWDVVDNFIILLYGEEAHGVCMWYLLERFDEEGNIRPWVDIDNKEYEILSLKELWKFIEFNFSE